MTKIKVTAGDYGTGSGRVCDDRLELPGGAMLFFPGILSIEPATEESVKRIGGTIGWGVAGAALLGPAGMLAGLLLGGRSKEVTFIVRAKGDKKLLATTDVSTFTRLKASTF